MGLASRSTSGYIACSSLAQQKAANEPTLIVLSKLGVRVGGMPVSPLDDFFGVRIVIAERIAFAIKDTHRAVAPIFVSGEYAVFIDVAIIAMAPALNR